MRATELTKRSVRPLLPPRPQDAHKGTFGHLFVIAGSRGFSGAATMVGRAAARAGAGLVTIGTPKPLADVVAAGTMELMTLPLPATRAEAISSEALKPALSFAKDKSAVAIGPGLSQQVSTRTFVRAFVAKCAPPIVIDADGLNAIAGNTRAIKGMAAPCILTPHPGEMARLCEKSTADVQKNREEAAVNLAEALRCVVVLKGHRTIVAGPEGQVYVNLSGNPGMATGGTGDVLTGILGGLLAQGMMQLDAARLGVYLHGLAGDFAATEKTERGLIAGDVIEKIPTAWRYIEGAFEP